MAAITVNLCVLALTTTLSAMPGTRTSDKSNLVHAEPELWSYTFEELRQRAYAFHQLTLGKGPVEDRAFIEQLLMAGEFRGYIAAALDQVGHAGSFNECAKRADLTNVAAGIATRILRMPNEGSPNAWFIVRSATALECSKQ